MAEQLNFQRRILEDFREWNSTQEFRSALQNFKSLSDHSAIRHFAHRRTRHRSRIHRADAMSCCSEHCSWETYALSSVQCYGAFVVDVGSSEMPGGKRIGDCEF
jgi:hypothetical protein